MITRALTLLFAIVVLFVASFALGDDAPGTFKVEDKPDEYKYEYKDRGCEFKYEFKYATGEEKVDAKGDCHRIRRFPQFDPPRR